MRVEVCTSFVLLTVGLSDVTFNCWSVDCKRWKVLGIFSSPELKAKVNYSDRLLSVVRLSVCLSVCPSVCKLLHFRLLLQNHWANFNQTWHKSFLGEGIQVCSNEGDCPSPRGDNSKRVKISATFKLGLDKVRTSRTLFDKDFLMH
jgi:hypothetical protein